MKDDMQGLPEALEMEMVLSAQDQQGVSETEKVMNEFEAHERSEGKYTQRYKEIAETTKSPLVKFLLGLIVSDEERHHAVTRAMAANLEESLRWTKIEGAMPGIEDLAEADKELVHITEEFIQVEKQGIAAYKDLMKATKGYHAGLFALLLKSMVHDSEKHIDILEFLRANIKRR
jgi:bacterioferritin (cytochrome b1)